GYAVPDDAGTEQGVRDLISAARRHLGEIDIYCSNAGIGAGTTTDTTGRGCFVVTASAAGLLTMLGSAPYSVTKHAAEGYAEWLAATYAHRGLTVHCICPQGVKTSMLAASRPARSCCRTRRSSPNGWPRRCSRAWRTAGSSSCRIRRYAGTTS